MPNMDANLSTRRQRSARSTSSTRRDSPLMVRKMAATSCNLTQVATGPAIVPTASSEYATAEHLVKAAPIPAAAISSAHMAELYVHFCSLLGDDNKVDVARFMQLCDAKDITSRLGYRLTSALYAALKHKRLDWATMAWYIDAPPGSKFTDTGSTVEVAKGVKNIFEEIQQTFPVLRSTSDLRRARQFLRTRGGLRTAVLPWLQSRGFVKPGCESLDGDNEENVFAHTITSSDALLGPDWQESFMVVHNLPEHDDRWEDPAFEGRSAMGPRHRLLCLKQWQHFKWFNGLVFGLCHSDLDEALRLVKDLREAADHYRKAAGWGPIGLFLHLFGHNSVHMFHLHMVELLHVGPSFHAFRHKNCPLSVLEKVLEDEIRAANTSAELKHMG